VSVFLSLISFSQNKKEQIAILGERVDSCYSVITSQKVTFLQTADLLKAEKQRTMEKDKQIEALEKEKQTLADQKQRNLEKYRVKKGNFEIINIAYNEDVGYPTSIINAFVNGKKIKIAEVTGDARILEKSDYSNFDIPENAIEACTSWWAGGGDSFYMVATENGIDIYQGWQDEGQEEPGHHWEKKISLFIVLLDMSKDE